MPVIALLETPPGWLTLVPRMETLQARGILWASQILKRKPG